MARRDRRRGAGPLSHPQKMWFGNGTGGQSNPSANPAQAPSTITELSIVDVDFSGIPPGYCHLCRRDFQPHEPVYFGQRDGYPARAGECCSSSLAVVVFRETRWRQ